MIKRRYRRLPLENLYNARDLGGYIVDGHKCTKWFRFLRTDNMTHASESDRSFLKDYGLRTVIDLRSIEEVSDEPNPFKNDSDVHYYHCSLLVNDITKPTRTQLLDLVQGGNVLVSLYSGMLEDAKEVMKEIFEIIAQSEGTVLYHCTAGKDRTGVISALLLGLVGVKDADIINNYQETFYYLNESPFIHERATGVKMTKEMKELKDKFLNSDAENMRLFLEFVYDNYGGVKEYLLKIGIQQDVLDKIVESFTE